MFLQPSVANMTAKTSPKKFFLWFMSAERGIFDHPPIEIVQIRIFILLSDDKHFLLRIHYVLHSINISKTCLKEKQRTATEICPILKTWKDILNHLFIPLSETGQIVCCGKAPFSPFSPKGTSYVYIVRGRIDEPFCPHCKQLVSVQRATVGEKYLTQKKTRSCGLLIKRARDALILKIGLHLHLF